MTDHPIYPALRAALDALTPLQRRAFIRWAAENDGTSPYGGVLVGIACQLAAEELTDKAREDAVLYQLAEDRRAEIREIDRRIHGDAPPVEGVAAFVDPETGKFLNLESG